jgi:hypothetical protein
MALYDVTTITELADFLGAAEFEIDDMVSELYHGSVLERMIEARTLVYEEGTTLNSVEFDRIRQLAESMRLNETSMVDSLRDSLSLSVGAIDNYFRQTFEIGMREYYDGSDASHTVPWNDMFRQLWRREMNQELVIRLATAVKTGGIWVVNVVAPGIELPSGLEVRADVNIGPGNISLTIGLTTELEEDVNVGMLVAANTEAGTSTTITHGVLSLFTDLRTLDVSGGTNGDELSIWVSV